MPSRLFLSFRPLSLTYVLDQRCASTDIITGAKLSSKRLLVSIQLVSRQPSRMFLFRSRFRAVYQRPVGSSKIINVVSRHDGRYHGGILLSTCTKLKFYITIYQPRSLVHHLCKQSIT